MSLTSAAQSIAADLETAKQRVVDLTSQLEKAGQSVADASQHSGFWDRVKAVAENLGKSIENSVNVEATSLVDVARNEFASAKQELAKIEAEARSFIDL